MKEITIKDKGNRNVSVYKTAGCGLSLEIENDYKNLRGVIKNWTLNIYGEQLYNADSFDKLLSILQKIITDLDLKQYSLVKKDILVIYIDNLDKIRGFFEDYITDDFTHYVQVFNFIEFRDISTWNDELHNAAEIAEYAQFLIDNVFVPQKYFFLTPNQQVRKRIAKAAKKAGSNIAKTLFPDQYEYEYLRAGLFGGICYCPFPNLDKKEPIIEIDLDSAYIWSFLTQKHIMSKLYRVDTKNVNDYLSIRDKVSFGRYKLKFNCNTLKVGCYKDMYGNPVHLGLNEGTFILSSIDLKILSDLVNMINVECESLYEAELDYLPEYIRDILIDEYVKKEELKLTLGSKDRRTMLQKVRVNGIYGDSIRRYDSTLEVKRAGDKATMIPQWGILTTAYTKLVLLGLGLQLDGWYYSDTDSIYCKDTPKNRELIEKFNESIREETKEFCDRFGYDFDKLKNLGTFQIKNEIQRFKALGNKIYMYSTGDEVKLKAAGSTQTTVKKDDTLFNLKKIPVGEKTFGFIYNKSYIEITLEDENAELMEEYLVKKNALDKLRKLTGNDNN